MSDRDEWLVWIAFWCEALSVVLGVVLVILTVMFCLPLVLSFVQSVAQP